MTVDFLISTNGSQNYYTSRFLNSQSIWTAEVNVAISNIACGINITLLVLHLLRVLLGPYPLPVITAIYYLIRCQAKIIFTLQPFFRINITLITSLLTAKTVLMIAFMINFNLMTSESSKEPNK